MKYLKTFESKKRPAYRGFREKQKLNLSMERFKDFVPSSFIIFSSKIWTGEDMIVFARILKLEHTMPDKYSYNEREGFSLHVIIIDCVGPEKGLLKPGELRVFNPENNFEVLFNSTSLKKSEEKYQEIAADYILARDANTYNL